MRVDKSGFTVDMDWRLNWCACVASVQDKLEPSEALGDLLRQAGDQEAALRCYQQANVQQKVIEGLAAKGDFAELTRYSGAQVRLFPETVKQAEQDSVSSEAA